MRSRHASRALLLVSHWQGRVFHLPASGEPPRLLLDTTTPGTNIADFAYAPGHDLLLAPTFLSNGLVAYRVGLGQP